MERKTEQQNDCTQCIYYKICYKECLILDPIHGGVICEDFDNKDNYIKPPVYVDQTLYVYDRHNNPSFDRIVEVRVYAIRIDTAKNDKRFCVQEKDFNWEHNYMATFKWDSIGKSIFYTYKEAEDKMNRRRK